MLASKERLCSIELVTTVTSVSDYRIYGISEKEARPVIWN